MKKVLACTMFLGVVSSLPAAADDTKLRFKGGIGVIPVSSGVAVAPPPGAAPFGGRGDRNIIRGVSPPRQIWGNEEPRAQGEANRGNPVDRKGVVLGGGNW